jgi:hypothetical protein
LLPSTPSDLEGQIAQAAGRSQKEGDFRAGRVLYATARKSFAASLKFPSSGGQYVAANGVDVTSSRVEHAGKRSINTDTGRTVEEEARAVLISPWNAVLSKICARAVRSSCTSYADTRAAGVACSICTLICTLPKGSYGPLAPGCRVQRHAANRSSTGSGGMCPSDWYKRQYGPKVSGTRQKRISDQLRSIRFDFVCLSRFSHQGPKSQYTTSLHQQSLAVLQKILHALVSYAY